ncbi:pitrilysin family protein [Carboxydochorda subterranea]|uniref:Pitrilysin family protein n=1 Tax=Carboxydichorda subterranea TaxID=3109565 RepID=A0ABZ1BXL1_9FIRM|nr:pitrilysin family protein [Limnochorda sp. L945t]WRP16828.1 pitrilysin family protein [Limnochorda sp. L945t]
MNQPCRIREALRRRSLWLLAAILTLGVALEAAGQPAAAPSPSSPAPAPVELPPIPPITLPEAVEPVSLPPITRETLPNGLEVVVVERHGRPLAYALLSLPVGDVDSPVSNPAVATVTGDMLTKGTITRTALDIARAIESVGGRLGASVGPERTQVYAATLARHLPLALELMADVVRHPVFPEDELVIYRRQVEASIKQSWDDPATLAGLHAEELLYGNRHPLGHFTTPAEVDAVSREQLIAFHREHYSPKGARLLVSGDVEPAEVLELARRWLGDWEAAARAAGNGASAAAASEPRMAPVLPALEKSRIRFVEWPGQTQVRIELRQPGPPATVDDWLALSAYNYVLGGGGFASRLMRTVRSELGQTYDIHTYYERQRFPAAFVLSTYTRNAEVWKTLEVIRAELERFAREGVRPEELDDARQFMILSYPSGLETLSSLTASVDSALYLGRGLEWVSQFPVKVSQLTPEEVNAAIRRYFHPERFAIVLLGDPEVLQHAPPTIWGVPASAIEKVPKSFVPDS